MSVNVVSPSTGALSPIASRGQFIQYSVMPTPSVDIVNKIVQYIGTTTANYTNGYFYKCTEVSTGVYNWVNIQVQTGGGGSADNVVEGYFNSTDNLFYEESTYTTPIIGRDNTIYISLDTDLLYRYNSSIFIRVDEVDISDKADKVTSATNGDLASLNASGNLVDSGIASSDVIVKSATEGLIKNDGTIDTNTYLTESDIADKADIVENATNGDLAGLDANGNLTDSGVLASDILVKSSTAGLVKNDGTIDTNSYATTTQLADKTDKVDSATNGDLAGLNASGELTDSGILASNVIVKSNTTGLVKNDGTIDTNTYLTSADIADKADVVDGATADDFATLDASGNLTDSGINKNIVPSNASSSNKLATQSDVAAAYRPSGNATLATLPALTEANLNRVYNMTEDFVTTADFAEGAGISVKAGNEVGIIDVSSTSTPDIKYTVLGGFIDLSDYIQKSQTSGLVKNDGTIDTSTYATTTQLAGKADKVANASNGHLAGLDANGNLTDSGVLATSISGKADKVVSATDGDLAKLNSYGNLVDSGISASDVVVKSSTAGLIKNDGTIDTTSYATSTNAYSTGDTAETTLADTDYFPFYDTSATAKRKTLWSNIKSVLKTYFDGIYSTFSGSYNDLTNKPTIPSISNCYQSTDTAETIFADNDKVPFYDTSATAKRNSTWANIKSVLKTYFDTLYSTVKTRGTPTSGGTTLSLVNTGDMYNWDNKVDSVSVGSTGTASGSTVAYQRIGVGDASGSVTYTEINGTKYMELTTPSSSSSGVTSFVFTNNVITHTALYDIYSNVYGVAPTNVVAPSDGTTHTLTVNFNSSTGVTACRVYIRG